MNVKERLFTKTKPTLTGCLQYTGKVTKDGYGVIKIAGKSISTHRASYQSVYGSIPAGLSVCHRCDNPLCVNPFHLFVATHNENMADMRRKGRSLTGEKHPKVKLQTWQVLEIRDRYTSGGISQSKLAEEYGVGKTQLWRIVHNLKWIHLSKRNV